MSFLVRHGSEIAVFGRLTPFLECKNPPKTTFKTTVSLLFVETTSRLNFPSSKSTLSLGLTSFAKSL